MTNLEKLNQFTRREHSEEEVYLFDVILCNNDIDRDMEAFSEKALEQMQELFIGKTGIFDHNLKSAGQTARIYDTELVKSPDKKTKDGRPLISLKANAYTVRTDSNADFIKEIDGGIKKEVSVSCSAGRQICSVCGADKSEGVCSHIPGKSYGGKYCYTILDNIKDAYEWSFVAVPAQPLAGVTKQFTSPQDSALSEEQTLLLNEIERQMRGEVIQLCTKQHSGCVSEALIKATEKMDLHEIFQFKNSLLAEQQARLSNAEVQLSDFRQR